MAGVIGITASFMTALSLYREDYTSLLIAFGIWDIFSAFKSPAMETLFADSVPQGKRSLPFTIKHMIQQAATRPSVYYRAFWEIGEYLEITEIKNRVDVRCSSDGFVDDFLLYFDDEKAHENNEAKSMTTEKIHLLDDPLTLPDSSSDHPSNTTEKIDLLEDPLTLP